MVVKKGDRVMVSNKKSPVHGVMGLVAKVSSSTGYVILMVGGTMVRVVNKNDLILF